jgi:hypothetical protein
MKARRKMQVLIKVRFIKDFAGHSEGNIIETDMQTVNFLIEKGVCESFEKKEIAKEQSVLKPVEVEKPVVVKKPVVKKVVKRKHK